MTVSVDRPNARLESSTFTGICAELPETVRSTHKNTRTVFEEAMPGSNYSTPNDLVVCPSGIGKRNCEDVGDARLAAFCSNNNLKNFPLLMGRNRQENLPKLRVVELLISTTLEISTEKYYYYF